MDPLAWKTSGEEMKVVYAKEPFPEKVIKSIFLAGPTPRDKNVASWRPDALNLLREAGFDGHVFVPEPRDGQWSGDYTDQVEWEESGLHRADVILFWVPRDMKTMPALTTNVEWGLWADTGKAILGVPIRAESVRYLEHMAKKMKVPVFDSLIATTKAAVETLKEGALREGPGETQVPLHVWNHPTFQAWYKSQRAAGNRLDSARVLWTFRVGQKRDKVFSWCLHVNVHVTGEGRNKTNEFVLGRTDISAVALYCRPMAEGNHIYDDINYLYDTEFVLVREFRSPARTPTGDIMELPGGSSKNSDEETLQVAIDELREETSFKIDPTRLRRVGQLQLAGTLSAHTATLFAAEITRTERDQLRQIVASGKAHGVEGDSERTYVEVRTVRQLLEQDMVDWSTIGMMLTAAVLTR